MKTCSKCNEEKQRDSFYKDKDKKDGLSSHCKECRKAHTREWIKNNRDKATETRRAYAKSHRKEAIERAKKWRLDNPKKAMRLDREKYQKNKDSYKLRAALRKKHVELATPDWLSGPQMAHIKRTYKLREIISDATGIEYHVDHIAPLRGENVCGLHVPWNLQVIPAKDNLSKSNSTDHLNNPFE